MGNKAFNDILILLIIIFVFGFVLAELKKQFCELATVNEKRRYYLVNGYDTRSNEYKKDFRCIDVGFARGSLNCYDENGYTIAFFPGVESVTKKYDGE